MGLSQRVDKLQRSASNPERSQAIGSAAERLVDPTGMGSQYKVLGVTGHRNPVLSAEEQAKYDYPFVEITPTVSNDVLTGSVQWQTLIGDLSGIHGRFVRHLI